MEHDISNLQPMLTVDALVVGGGFAGLAAAVALAKAGKRVCLVEARSYLGTELFAPLCPWLRMKDLDAIERRFGDSDEAFVKRVGENVLAVVPDRLKIYLEDAVLESGIHLLYQLSPLYWERQDHLFRLYVAGKAGPVLLQASQLVDATSEGLLVRMLPGSKRRPVEAAWRTIEFTGVHAKLLETHRIDLPTDLTEAFRLHAGHLGGDHVLLEHAVRYDSSLSVVEMEVFARLQSMSIAKWLFDHHPAFAKAWVGSTSSELAVVPRHRVVSTESHQDGLLQVAESIYPVAAFQPVDGLWIASGCADVDDEMSQRFDTDIPSAMSLGQTIGEACAAHSRNVEENAISSHCTSDIRDVDVDVLVVGGGTSGASAAISAGQRGCRTYLLEQNAGLGGTGTLGGVNSYWYGRRMAFSQTVSRWVADEHRWMGIKENQGRWNIEAKMLALLKAAIRANVQVALNSILVDVLTDGSGRVTGAVALTPDGLVRVRANVTIDATGDGDVAVRAGAKYVYGADREHVTMWYSLAPLTKPGVPRNNWTSTVDIDHPLDITRAILSARRRYQGHDHSAYIAPRETRHIVGDVRLTLTDQLRMKMWPDVVNIAFSNHDIKGQSTSDWIRLGLIPPNLEVEIPLRALTPQGIDGLLVTGKAISATHDALPAIRMQADLENLGCVCGVTAALAVQRGTSPRRVPLQELQSELVEIGILPAHVVGRTMSEAALTKEEMQAWIWALDDSVHLYDYSDMEFDEVRREPIPIVMVCTAGRDIVPMLREELARPDSRRRLMVSRALAWYGDKAATSVLLEEIAGHLRAEVLPMRDSNIRHTQASPDQGAMPDLAYLLHTIAMVKDERAIPVLEEIVAKIDPTLERFHDNRSGIFHYVDSVCEIAEGIGSAACLPALQRLHSIPLFHGHVCTNLVQPDFFEERLAYLEITVARALARCGCGLGLNVLVDYLSDCRHTLVRYAHHELVDITGQTFGEDVDAWRTHVAAMREVPARPWQSPRGVS